MTSVLYMMVASAATPGLTLTSYCKHGIGCRPEGGFNLACGYNPACRSAYSFNDGCAYESNYHSQLEACCYAMIAASVVAVSLSTRFGYACTYNYACQGLQAPSSNYTSHPAAKPEPTRRHAPL